MKKGQFSDISEFFSNLTLQNEVDEVDEEIEVDEDIEVDKEIEVDKVV